MCSIEDQIPLFPSSFVPENRDAIDFNSYDIIAVGCGSSINFSYVQNFELKPAFSITIGTSYVTALKFHPVNELLFIGDSKGNLFIYDYSKRLFASHPFSFEENSSITQICFLDLGLLVLNKGCAFGFLDVTPKNSKYQFSIVWKNLLPEKTTNFCVDPYRKSRIFIYGRNTNFFMLYSLDKIKKTLKPITEQSFLSNNLTFQDAQYSLHIRNYIFFITEQKVMLYNVECHIAVSITHFQKTSSFLDRFIQFPTDDSKLLCFHKSGAITIFEVREPFNLVSIAEIPFTQQVQQLFMYCLSSLRDDYLACVYSPLGLTLFDLSTFKMVSILPYWCDQTSTFATSGVNYAIGTHKGYIVYGNLFKPEEKAVFRISKKPVTFLSILPEKHIIYWATDGDVGEIDTGFRKLTRYPEHCLSTTKTVGTISGGFMVQRESSVLGLFIDGNEVCIPTKHNIIDFCFNDDGSNTSAGSVMLILETGVILFVDYSKVHGVNKNFTKREANFNIFYTSCSAWRGNNFAIGFKDGIVMTMEIDSNEFERYDIRDVPITKIQYCEDELFVLSEDGNLYSIRNGDVVHCSNMIRNFFIVSSVLFTVIKFDYSIVFVKRSGFESLSLVSKALPLPERGQHIVDFLMSNPVLVNTNYIIANEEEEDDNDFHGQVEFDKIHSLGNIMAMNLKSPVIQRSRPTRTMSNNAKRARSRITPQKSYSYNTASKLCQNIPENLPLPPSHQQQDISEESINISENSQNISENSQNISEDSLKNSEDSQNVSENSLKMSEDSQNASEESLHVDQDNLLNLINNSNENASSFQSTHSVISYNFGAYIPQVFSKHSAFNPADRLIPYMSKEGRDFWLHLLNQPSLRLMNISALGNSSRYENTLANILSLLDYTPSLQPIIFDAFLFAHRTEEADKLLSKESPSSPTFMTNSIIGTALVSFDEEMTEQQVARIKSAGIALIMNNKRKEGGKLLRIAKLDSVAASYLIQAGHPIEAMRFVRSLTSEEEKKKDCFEVALKYVEKSRYVEAMLLFITSGEYHPALFCLVKLRLIIDAYVIKAFLLKKKMLREVKGQKALSIPNLVPLKKLCQTIDAQFSSLLMRNNIDAHKFKLTVKPRALSNY